MREKAAIGLGGNVASSVGKPAETLGAALALLRSDSVSVVAVSRFWRSAAYPAGSGPDYVNAAALLDTDLAPTALLARLMEVEAALGRERSGRWAARTIDLDLLWMGGMVLPDLAVQSTWRNMPAERQARETPDTLILPHPRLQERAFVLIPLMEIAPGWRHPVIGQTVAEMCAGLSDAAKAEIRPI